MRSAPHAHSTRNRPPALCLTTAATAHRYPTGGVVVPGDSRWNICESASEADEASAEVHRESLTTSAAPRPSGIARIAHSSRLISPVSAPWLRPCGGYV